MENYRLGFKKRYIYLIGGLLAYKWYSKPLDRMRSLREKVVRDEKGIIKTDTASSSPHSELKQRAKKH